MNYDIRKASQTLVMSETITCRALEHQAVHKTILSVDDTKQVNDMALSESSLAQLSTWMGRPVRSIEWLSGRRLIVYHD